MPNILLLFEGICWLKAIQRSQYVYAKLVSMTIMNLGGKAFQGLWLITIQSLTKWIESNVLRERKLETEKLFV
jgi:hypothetical protein